MPTPGPKAGGCAASVRRGEVAIDRVLAQMDRAKAEITDEFAQQRTGSAAPRRVLREHGLARAGALWEHPSPLNDQNDRSAYSGQPALGDGWSIRSGAGGELCIR